MDAQSNSSDRTPGREQNPLAVPEVPPTPPAVETIQEVLPVVPQSEAAAQQQSATEIQISQQPLLVHVTKDDALSAFEQRTISYGGIGVLVAFLALVAASVTAYFIIQQFKEMAAQTDISSRAAKQARIDAKDSGIAIAKQLAILQSQLTQQRAALQIDQRPWLKFELGGDRPKDADPNNGKWKVLTTTAGQPIKIEVRVTNIGKTTAEKILGTLIVQYVPKGGKPILPRKKNQIMFTEGKKREKRALPGTAWMEATLYPGEVSQNYFSRSRWEADGTVKDDPISPTEKAELDNGNAYILLLGEIWYSDVFGARHWTKFCEIGPPHLADASVEKKCIAFGAVDANQPK